jgi:hypothetical protein
MTMNYPMITPSTLVDGKYVVVRRIPRRYRRRAVAIFPFEGMKQKCHNKETQMLLHRTEMIKARFSDLIERTKELMDAPSTPDRENALQETAEEIGELKMEYYALTGHDLSQEA